MQLLHLQSQKAVEKRIKESEIKTYLPDKNGVILPVLTTINGKKLYLVHNAFIESNNLKTDFPVNQHYLLSKHAH